MLFMGATSLLESEIVSLHDLVDAVASAERHRAALALATAEHAADGGFRADGALSITGWLEHHARMSHGDAARLLSEGRFLRRNRAVATAAVSGQLSAAQVALLRRTVTKPTADLFEEHQQAIVDALIGRDLPNSEVVCERWRTKAEASVPMPEPPLPERSLKLSPCGDGTHFGTIVLDAAGAAQFRQALDTARTWNGDDDTRTTRERDVDAFDSIMSFFNRNHDRPESHRHRPHVELNLNVEDLYRRAGPCAVVRNGQTLPVWTTDTLLCDCVLHRVLRAPGTVTDYGRATRSVPANLARMVIARDHGCRFCDRPSSWCEIHHVDPWYPSGVTKLENLMLLCDHHHRMIHRDRWTIVLHDDGAVTFTGPDGRTIHRQPRLHTATGPPVAA